MSEKLWWEISITIEATQAEAESLADHLADNVICQHFGGDHEGIDGKDDFECPVQWAMGLSPVRDEEEE